MWPLLIPEQEGGSHARKFWYNWMQILYHMEESIKDLIDFKLKLKKTVEKKTDWRGDMAFS